MNITKRKNIICIMKIQYCKINMDNCSGVQAWTHLCQRFSDKSIKLQITTYPSRPATAFYIGTNSSQYIIHTHKE